MKYRWTSFLCALALAVSAAPFAFAEELPEIIAPPEAGAVTVSEAPTELETFPAPEVPTETEGTESTPAPEPPSVEPGQEPEEKDTVVLVGLVYGDKALAGANLSNGVGSGYRFGYLDAERDFQQVGVTLESSISVVKTQNVYYGYPYGNNLITYSDTVTSDVLVGCWHVLLPVACASAEEAQTAADQIEGAFPAWIDGTWQVRLGAFGTQEQAQTAADTVGGTVAGTSAYGVSVVKTKTAQILFQFDGGKEISLTVMPGQGGGEKTVTHFKGNKYYGGFQYQRIGGGNLTISSVLGLEDYTNCVLTQEMSPSWPLEALKAQAVCARTYYERHAQKHRDTYGFDVCCTTHCQAYPGMSNVNERTTQAIEETKGLRVWYEGELADTVYFASDGGGTEDARNVWGGEDFPYLAGVVDPYEETIAEKIAYWDYSKSFTASELSAIIQPYAQSKGYNCAAIVDFRVTELSETGNVKSVVFTDANGMEWPFTQERANAVRGLLGLQSIRYTVAKTEGSGTEPGRVYYTDGGGTLSSMNGVYAIKGDHSVGKLSGNPYVIAASGTQFLPGPTGGSSEGETVFTITSRGNGHSVGMSQWGAYAMAQQGMSFMDILTFYYTGVDIY